MPILVAEAEAALADAREARDAGADLVEFRLDAFFHGEGFDKEETQTKEIIRMISACPLPCIVTCRPVLEGGHYDGPDDARIALFERLGALASSGRPGEVPPRYIDCELATYTRSANLKQKVNLAVDHPGQRRELATSLILSTHDFHSRPGDLFRQIDRMHTEAACRVVKIAYRARSLRDNLELLDILADAQSGRGGDGGKPTIALGMGPFGLMSRVLAPKFEGFLTFASLRGSSATAPGQPTVRELTELYRFRAISSATKVYGVVGYPVEHSLSPHVHNAGFEAVGHDGVYLPLPVPPEFEHLKATLLDLIDHSHLDLSGLSVTIPHKENLVRLAREMGADGDDRWVVAPAAERCGAGNTLTITRDGRGRATKMVVDNSDGTGMLKALSEALGENPVRGKRVLLLGVGGTAKSLAHALLEAGATVLIHNRTAEKAVDLAAALQSGDGRPNAAAAVGLDGIGGAGPDVVINCTPVGMAAGPIANEDGRVPVGLSPLAEPVVRNLPGHCVVAECVYSPLKTPLLRQAEGAGLRTIHGLTMFVHQAGEQFEQWTRRKAPLQLFLTVATETLAARWGSR